MPNISLTDGEQYTFGKIGGTTVILSGTDDAQAERIFRNNIEIITTADNGTTGNLFVNSNHTGNANSILGLKNSNNGADCIVKMIAYTNSWIYGIDSSDSNSFKISNNSNFVDAVYSDDFRITSAGDAYIKGELYVSNDNNYWNPSDGNQGMQVYNDATYVASFVNNGASTSGSRAALFRGGGDSTVSGVNTLVKFADVNNASLGFITFNGTTVTYGAFTGVHYANILQADSVSSTIIESDHTSTIISSSIYPPGTIVSIVKSNIPAGGTQAIHYVVSSSIHQDKRVFGVYESAFDVDIDSGELQHQHQIGSLGDHYILVCDQAGNIENGDYITTASGSGGYGCKQSDDIFHNYTVAKSLENVDWSTESNNTKLISCTLHCG